MGGSQSKTPQQPVVQPAPLISAKAYELTPQFTAPETVIEKIRGLGDVIRFFNDNDTTAIENFITNYNQKVSEKEKIDIGPEIKGMMMRFHNQLLEVIDTQLVGASQSEKEQVLKAKLKDNRQLNDMLSIYYNQKLKDIETKVMSDETVRGNREISETVRNILGNVKSLKIKYKFFEYKYIQMNVFMIVFIQYVYNSMTKFIVDVIAYNQARDTIRQEMTQKIFKATQEILGAQDLQIKPEDAEAINKMIANLQDKVRRDQAEIQDLSSKLKNGSLSDLMNFVVNSDQTLAGQIMQQGSTAANPTNVARDVQLAKAAQILQMQKQQQQQQQQQPQQPQPQQQQGGVKRKNKKAPGSSCGMSGITTQSLREFYSLS